MMESENRCIFGLWLRIFAYSCCFLKFQTMHLSLVNALLPSLSLLLSASVMYV
jgi:hypothetical protein